LLWFVGDQQISYLLLDLSYRLHRCIISTALIVVDVVGCRWKRTDERHLNLRWQRDVDRRWHGNSPSALRCHSLNVSHIGLFFLLVDVVSLRDAGELIHRLCNLRIVRLNLRLTVALELIDEGI
jgi:hypothetical protein